MRLNWWRCTGRVVHFCFVLLCNFVPVCNCVQLCAMHPYFCARCAPPLQYAPSCKSFAPILLCKSLTTFCKRRVVIVKVQHKINKWKGARVSDLLHLCKRAKWSNVHIWSSGFKVPVVFTASQFAACISATHESALGLHAFFCFYLMSTVQAL